MLAFKDFLTEAVDKSWKRFKVKFPSDWDDPTYKANELLVQWQVTDFGDIPKEFDLYATFRGEKGGSKLRLSIVVADDDKAGATVPAPLTSKFRDILNKTGMKSTQRHEWMTQYIKDWVITNDDELQAAIDETKTIINMLKKAV